MNLTEKKEKLLIVIDMQNDFVTGALGSPDAQFIVPRIAEKLRDPNLRVLFTADTHSQNYLDTQEGLRLPVPHCISSTPGWEIVSQLRTLRPDAPVVEKHTFGSVCLGSLVKRMADAPQNPITEVELAGVCTDLCVISNALLIKAFCPELPITVDASCCAGSTFETHQAALRVMRACQIQIIREADAV